MTGLDLTWRDELNADEGMDQSQMPGQAPRGPATAPVTDLDPDDWQAFRRQAHAALDEVIGSIASIREQPVWQPMPAAVRARFAAPLPRQGRDLGELLAVVNAGIAPFATGNRHPRFMGWVHGAGTPVGMVAEMISAGLNMNCGGRDHIGLELERQVARWSAELLGYPAEASGLFVTGTSMANLLALVVARTHALGIDIRRKGMAGDGHRLVAYTSREAHGCIAQAMELSGIGSASLRRIDVDADLRLCPRALADAIRADRGLGLTPFLVVGTAGTVNTGAIDPLTDIAAVAEREGLWFHVDGAFGALAALSPSLKPLLAGIERSQSVAFDFHKWGHVPYDAGFLLVKDAAAHRAAFASPVAYLQRAARGLAAGDTWPCDLGPDLSRGCRALKTWLTIATLGADRMGAAIAGTCELARRMAAMVHQSAVLELAAPVALNIVCFSVRGSADGQINREIVLDLHEAGLAAPSWTTLGGRTVIRAAIVNHRTTAADVDAVVAEIEARARGS